MRKGQKSVCIVGPALKMGGMERASVTLANTLAQNGVIVTYIAFFRQQHFFRLHENITLHEPNGFNEINLSILRTIPWLRKTIKAGNPDKVLSFSRLYSAITVLSLIFTKYPVYISERSSPLYRWPKIQELISKITFSIFKPEGIIAQTNIAAKYQKRYYGKDVQIKVIPNAVRKIQFYPEVNRKKIILAVGRLNDPLKGFDRLLEAFAQINTKDWILQIAGGHLKDDSKLFEIVEKNQLNDRVQFLGKVSEMDRLYAEVGMFVIPSRSEGFPNALCEAMVAGVPCISFDFIAGPRDIIKDEEDGFIIEDGNLKALGNKILFLINNPEIRNEIGARAKQNMKRFEAERINAQIMDFLLPN